MRTIRPYDAADLDDVVVLGEELTDAAAPWRDAERWSALVRGWLAESIDVADSPARPLFVCSEDDVVLGFVALSTRMHATGDVDAYVGMLAVAPGARRRGIARALLEVAASWAASQGHTVLNLDTAAANTATRQFYASVDFDEEDVRLSKVLEARSGPAEPD